MAELNEHSNRSNEFVKQKQQIRCWLLVLAAIQLEGNISRDLDMRIS